MKEHFNNKLVMTNEDYEIFESSTNVGFAIILLSKMMLK